MDSSEQKLWEVLIGSQEFSVKACTGLMMIVPPDTEKGKLISSGIRKLMSAMDDFSKATTA